MAQLALAAAGAVAGGFIGGPAGASLGWTLGSVGGAMLFPEDGPTREGPRLQDLTVSASSYGDAIKIGYGTVRMNGNVIWSSGLRERRNTDTVGGKGMGGNATTVSYQYTASWAAAFAEGPAEAVIRIWFDTHLVYDATNIRDLFPKRTFTFRFYPGDEAQLPDPAIEAHVGGDAATAHRGLVTIVFDDVLLQDYGNRIPNVTAEIAFKTTSLYPTESLEMGPFASLLRASVYPDWERELLFAWGTDTDGDRRIGVWDATSLDLLYSRKVEDIVGYTPELAPGANLFAMPDGYLYFTTEEYGNDSADPYDLVKVEPNSLTMVARLEYPDGPESRPEYGGGCAGLNSDGTYDYFFALTDAFGTEWTMFRCNPFHRLGYYNVVNKIGPMVAIEPQIGLAGMYVFGNHTTLGGDVHVIKIAFTPGFTGDPPVATWLPSMSTVDTWVEDVDLAGDFDNMDGAFAFRYEEWFYVAVPGDTNNYLVKWNEENGIADTLTFPSSAWAAGSQGFANNNINIEGGVLLFPTAETGPGGASYTKVYKIDLASFTVVDILDADPFPQEFSGFWSASYDGEQHKILTAGSGGFTNAWYERGDGFGVPLSAIVSDLCLRAGLTADQIDVNELTDTVRSYALTRQTAIRTAVEQLAQGFFFDGVESDGKLKFLKRGRASSAAILQQDLGAERDNDYWPEARTQETELPRRFALTYMDVDRDYQEGTQHSRRMVVPSPTMESRDEQTLQLPIVWTATEAKQIAERWLYTIWLERSSYRTLLGPRYLRLDPADVVTVTLNDGTVYTVRVGTVDVGVGFALAVEARQEDAALYVSTAVGDGGSGMPEDVVVTDQPSELFVLDTPLLRDVDDLGGGVSRYYLAAGLTRAGTTWPGAAVYRSQDDGMGERRAVANTGASWGWVIGSALGDTASPFAPDTENTVTVRMIEGGDDLASITDTELVNGGNPALVGDEIIQFRDVTDNGDGTYTLSHLLRGRRGTDVFTGSHAVGERILILDAATLQADSADLGLLDQTLWWRAVTDGRSLSSVTPEAQPLTGRDLKPYAPVQAARADSAGDIVLSWQRRTRIGGAWRDGTGVAPLSEDSESYQVDVLSGAGGTVKRTLTSSTNSVTYASADVTTDFGSAPPDLYVRIVQISAVVGCGFHYQWKLRDGEPGERLSGGD